MTAREYDFESNSIMRDLLALEAQAIREGSSLKNSNYSARATKIIADVFTKTKKYRQDMILSKPYINTNKFGANMAFMKEQEFHTMREKAKAALIEIISEIQYKKLKNKVHFVYPPHPPRSTPAAGGKRKTRRAKKNTRSRK